MNQSSEHKPEEYGDALMLRESIIKKLSQEQQIPLHVVKAVIDNQFRTAYKAIDTCNSVEIAGFGKFMFRVNRGKVYIKYCLKGIETTKRLLEDPTGELTEMRREGLLVKLEKLGSIIEYLTKKINK